MIAHSVRFFVLNDLLEGSLQDLLARSRLTVHNAQQSAALADEVVQIAVSAFVRQLLQARRYRAELFVQIVELQNRLGEAAEAGRKCGRLQRRQWRLKGRLDQRQWLVLHVELVVTAEYERVGGVVELKELLVFVRMRVHLVAVRGRQSTALEDQLREIGWNLFALLKVRHRLVGQQRDVRQRMVLVDLRILHVNRVQLDVLLGRVLQQNLQQQRIVLLLDVPIGEHTGRAQCDQFAILAVRKQTAYRSVDGKRDDASR